jgi:transposase
MSVSGFPPLAPDVIVIIFPVCQRQDMGLRGERKKNTHRNRAVYNEWRLYPFRQMLSYQCVLYGKELVILDD